MVLRAPGTFYSYRQKVDVAVAPAAPVDYKVATASFIENNWKWLATTLVLPAGAMLWAYLRKRRERAAGGLVEFPVV